MINSSMPQSAKVSPANAGSSMAELSRAPDTTLYCDHTCLQIFCQCCIPCTLCTCIRQKLKVTDTVKDHYEGERRYLNIINNSFCCPMQWTASDAITGEKVAMYTGNCASCCAFYCRCQVGGVPMPCCTPCNLCAEIEVHAPKAGTDGKEQGEKLGSLDLKCCCCNKCNNGNEVKDGEGKVIMYHGSNYGCCGWICNEIKWCCCCLCRCKDNVHPIPFTDGQMDKQIAYSTQTVPCLPSHCTGCCPCLKRWNTKYPATIGPQTRLVMIGSQLFLSHTDSYDMMMPSKWLDSFQDEK